MSADGITWFSDFMGVGYRFNLIPTGVLLIFENKSKLLNAWHRVVKWWPDDTIRMRFVEGKNSYEFVLYGESRILRGKWVFLKSLDASDHYTRFKEYYEGAARLSPALYKPKDESYELRIFKYKKTVTDVQFLKEDEAEQDSIVLRSRRILHGRG